MLDLATVPLEVYADWLEEQGEDPQELREYIWLGLFVVDDGITSDNERGEPAYCLVEDQTAQDEPDIFLEDLIRGEARGSGYRIATGFSGTYLDY